MTFHNFTSDMMVYGSREQNYYHALMSEHTHPHAMHNLIDPRLNQNKAGPPQMQRYLQEPNSMLINAPQPQTMLDFISGLPPGSHRRHDSPFSQQNSPGSSSAQSPPTESDLCHDGTQGPSTPPDMAALSPFMAYDYVDSQMQFPFTSYMGDQSCVALADINPVHNMPAESHGTETPIDFSVDGFGMDGTNSPHFEHPVFIHNVIPPQAPSEAGSFVKKAPYVQYPGAHDLVEDLKAEDEISDLPPSTRDDEDSDYKPPSRPSGNAGTPRRSRAASMTSSPKRARQFKNTTISRSKPKPITPSTGNLNLCVHCSTPFKDDAALQKHTKQQHTRPFVCVFHYAGCISTFATKNEWKRHVVSQHLALNYWLCTADSCAKTTGPSTQQRAASLPSHGAIFNRKDLYTQHVRRMHAPPHARKAVRSKKPAMDWESQLQAMQDHAKMDRCALPTFMRCPAAGCGHISDGPAAWNDRMEHVARHLERAAVGEEPAVCFGGYTDQTLTDWAEQPGVEVVRRTAAGWELCNPLKGEGGGQRKTSAVVEAVYEEDAEGEDC